MPQGTKRSFLKNRLLLVCEMADWNKPLHTLTAQIDIFLLRRNLEAYTTEPRKVTVIANFSSSQSLFHSEFLLRDKNLSSRNSCNMFLS